MIDQLTIMWKGSFQNKVIFLLSEEGIAGVRQVIITHTQLCVLKERKSPGPLC